MRLDFGFLALAIFLAACNGTEGAKQASRTRSRSVSNPGQAGGLMLTGMTY